MNYFGQNLRMLRKRYNMKTRDLAEQLGVCESTIRCYENGLREPKLEKLIAISEILHISIDTLVKKQITIVEPEQLEFDFN